jgi:hypothetical protein
VCADLHAKMLEPVAQFFTLLCRYAVPELFRIDSGLLQAHLNLLAREKSA